VGRGAWGVGRGDRAPEHRARGILEWSQQSARLTRVPFAQHQMSQARQKQSDDNDGRRSPDDEDEAAATTATAGGKRKKRKSGTGTSAATSKRKLDAEE
jgi:hypothetical protein